MTTEDKIQKAYQAFEDEYAIDHTIQRGSYVIFRAGYMALLNELEWASGYNALATYYLPEGVEKS